MICWRNKAFPKQVSQLEIGGDKQISRHLSGSAPFKAQVLTVIAASRTRLWLASGWECRGRRLSRERRKPDKTSELFACRHATYRHPPCREGGERRSHNSTTARDGRGFSGIRRQQPRPVA